MIDYVFKCVVLNVEPPFRLLLADHLIPPYFDIRDRANTNKARLSKRPMDPRIYYTIQFNE